MSQAIEDTMRRFVAEVMNQGNYDVVDEIVDPNYVYRSPDEELHGAQALKAFLAAYRTAFPDLRMAIDHPGPQQNRKPLDRLSLAGGVC